MFKHQPDTVEVTVPAQTAQPGPDFRGDASPYFRRAIVGEAPGRIYIELEDGSRLEKDATDYREADERRVTYQWNETDNPGGLVVACGVELPAIQLRAVFPMHFRMLPQIELRVYWDMHTDSPWVRFEPLHEEAEP